MLYTRIKAQGSNALDPAPSRTFVVGVTVVRRACGHQVRERIRYPLAVHLQMIQCPERALLLAGKVKVLVGVYGLMDVQETVPAPRSIRLDQRFVVSEKPANPVRASARGVTIRPGRTLGLA